MKFLALILALAIPVAHADISSPQVPLAVPKCGTPSITTTVGELDTAGNYPGVVLERSHCNISGRGAKVRYYGACLRALWDANGYLIEYETLWSVSSLTPVTLACP